MSRRGARKRNAKTKRPELVSPPPHGREEEQAEPPYGRGGGVLLQWRPADGGRSVTSVAPIPAALVGSRLFGEPESHQGGAGPEDVVGSTSEEATAPASGFDSAEAWSAAVEDDPDSGGSAVGGAVPDLPS